MAASTVCPHCGFEGRPVKAQPYRYKRKGLVMICKACKGAVGD